MAGELCYLDWDSAHFGVRIGRVEGRRLTPALAEGAGRWVEREGIDCLYFLSEAEAGSMRAAAAAGFRLVDLRTTLTTDFAGCEGEETARIRRARVEDIPELRRIAGESHRDTRFYADGNFPRERCDELYRIWIERLWREGAGAVLVAEQDGRAAGYLACGVAADGEGRVELLATDNRHRGLGLGEQMLRRACRWLEAEGAEGARVVTQGGNLAALRIYQRAGFLVEAVELWYHRWTAR